MKKPVCTDCQIAMSRKEKGVSVVETYLDPPEPYKVWSADLYECTECGKQVVTDFATKPFWECFYDEELQLPTDSSVFYEHERRVNNGS